MCDIICLVNNFRTYCNKYINLGLAAVGLLNTISVSFRGVRSSQLVHALASKVCWSAVLAIACEARL